MEAIVKSSGISSDSVGIGTLGLGGSAGNLLEIRSTVPGSEAFLDLDQPAIGDYVSVQDSHAVDQPVALGVGSQVLGNTAGWSLSVAIPTLGLVGASALAGGLYLSGRRRLRKLSGRSA